MTQFEFLMALASVILAVGLAELLGGWGKVARSTLPIRWSALWIGWSLLVVALTVMYWSGMWPYRDQSFREGYKIFWLAIPTFFLVVLSYLLSPEPIDDEREVDLEARYWKLSSRMFPLLTALLVFSQLADVVIMGGPLATTLQQEIQAYWNAGAAYTVVLLVFLIASGMTKRTWLHWATLALMSVGPILFLSGLFGFGRLFR